MNSIPRVLIFLAFLLPFFPTSVYSQQDPKEIARQYMEQAELIMAETKAMDDARELMVTAADQDTTFIKANYEAGRMHLLTVGKNRAVKYLLRVFRQDPAISLTSNIGLDAAISMERILTRLSNFIISTRKSFQENRIIRARIRLTWQPLTAQFLSAKMVENLFPRQEIFPL